MKIGAMNNPMNDLIKELQWIGEHRFDFVDLTLEPTEAYSSNVQIDIIRDILNKYELEAIGHTAYYLPLASPFNSFCELALKELCKCFEIFHALGIYKVNIHADEQSTSIFSKDRALAKNIKTIKIAVQEAMKYDIKLMIENTVRLFGNVNELQMLFDKIPEIQFHLDVGHANLNTDENRTEELLNHFHKRLEHVHFSDNKGGNADLHLPLGAGLINWDKIVNDLKKYKYDGTITLEVFSRDKRYLLASRDKVYELWDKK